MCTPAIVISQKVYWYPLQGQENIESKIIDYEHALDSAATLYHQIRQLATTQSNDYSLDVMTRLTTATINFKNKIEQTDAAWVLDAIPVSLLFDPVGSEDNELSIL